MCLFTKTISHSHLYPLRNRGWVSASPTFPAQPRNLRPVVHCDPFKLSRASSDGSRSCRHCSKNFRVSRKQVQRIIEHQKIHRCEHLASVLYVDLEDGWEKNPHTAWQELEFILQCRHAKTFPAEPEDIKMPSIEWEEIPKGQKGWCDLDREGNVNWYYDQFSGEWVECPLPVLGIGNCIRHYDKFWGE